MSARSKRAADSCYILECVKAGDSCAPQIDKNPIVSYMYASLIPLTSYISRSHTSHSSVFFHIPYAPLPHHKIFLLFPQIFIFYLFILFFIYLFYFCSCTDNSTCSGTTQTCVANSKLYTLGSSCTVDDDCVSFLSRLLFPTYPHLSCFFFFLLFLYCFRFPLIPIQYSENCINNKCNQGL